MLVLTHRFRVILCHQKYMEVKVKLEEVVSFMLMQQVTLSNDLEMSFSEHQCSQS